MVQISDFSQKCFPGVFHFLRAKIFIFHLLFTFLRLVTLTYSWREDVKHEYHEANCTCPEFLVSVSHIHVLFYIVYNVPYVFHNRLLLGLGLGHYFSSLWTDSPYPEDHIFQGYWEKVHNSDSQSVLQVPMPSCTRTRFFSRALCTTHWVDVLCEGIPNFFGALDFRFLISLLICIMSFKVWYDGSQSCVCEYFLIRGQDFTLVRDEENNCLADSAGVYDCLLRPVHKTFFFFYQIRTG